MVFILWYFQGSLLCGTVINRNKQVDDADRIDIHWELFVKIKYIISL